MPRAPIVYPSFLRGEPRLLAELPAPAPAVLTQRGQPQRAVQLLAWLTPPGAAAPDLAEIRYAEGGRCHVAAAHVRPRALTSGEVIPFPGRGPRA